MLAHSTTEQIIQAVEQHPQRWQKVTREAALSLPVPVLSAGQAGLAFFWYPVGGPIQSRVVGAPTYRVLAGLSQLDSITFLPTDSAQMGLGVASGQPLGKPTIGGGVPPAEMKQVRADLYRTTDRMLEIYARAAASPNVYPDEDERAEMAAYRAAFRRLAVVVLLPAYRALSPHSFAWMDVILGPEL